MSKNKADNVIKTIVERKMSRPRGWNRDALVRFMVNRTGFRGLPAYSSDALSAEGKARGTVKGWPVPAECFDGPITNSMRNSLHAYIEKTIIPAMVLNGDTDITIDKVATHMEGDGDNVRVMIFRKA